ncbi:MAG TPA: tRNA (N6-threonylcarbamoyladenosine(37)-N6)-methyltransferase TrmO [Methanolinea sp.]|nr:tRNA (N6-threonylcarbamoyladenosine(37)-N6)-methyltransferase TrmO [Methanolinea sp.]
MEICYKPIGVIHSGFTDQKTTPIQSIFSTAEGTLEIFPEYAAGLKDLEGFSHLILLYHFHNAGGMMLVQRPFADVKSERGIFAIRHFARPNPIGLSIVDLIGIEDNILRVSGIDILDKTPLIDIKPYIYPFDNRSNVRSGWVDKRDLNGIRDAGATPEGLKDH